MRRSSPGEGENFTVNGSRCANSIPLISGPHVYVNRVAGIRLRIILRF
jgi:hypothetical protein